MGRWDNYGERPEWMDERQEQIAASMSAFDVTESDILPMTWNGSYIFRILPTVDEGEFDHLHGEADWMTPFGYHWNVFPTGDSERTSSQDGCPKATYGEECPLCNAIDHLIATKRVDKKEFMGEGGIVVRKQYYLRVLLLSTTLKKGTSKRRPPHWKDGDLPAVKILPLPVSVANSLMGEVDDEDMGWDKLTHPKEGLKVKVVRNTEENDPKKIYTTKVLPESYAIPDEFLDDEALERWPDIREYLPECSTKMMLDKIQQHAMGIDSRIANEVLSIDAETPKQKQLPAAELPSADKKKKTIEEMRERLKGGKNKREKKG